MFIPTYACTHTKDARAHTYFIFLRVTFGSHYKRRMPRQKIIPYHTSIKREFTIFTQIHVK